MKHVAVLGGGSFGTALAQLCARCGLKVKLWMRSEVRAAHINAEHRNPDYLSDFELSHNLSASTDIEDVVVHSDWIIVAVPSHAVRDTMKLARNRLKKQPVVLACKGIENETIMTMQEVVLDVLGADWNENVMALSGPSFAKEIMAEQPTAVVLASANTDSAMNAAERIRSSLFCDSFRAYSSTDMVGVEMGGALKNVMAIAAGCASGMGLGANTRATLVTRGLAEMNRLAVAKGANPLTLAGLAGVGDMILTCTGGLSRNRAIGQALGEGLTLKAAIHKVKQVAEGVKTTASAQRLAEQLNIDAPITNAVYSVLYAGEPVQNALLNLLRRAPGRELD